VARIGVLGGTFNPVHIAHLAVADEVRQEADLDEIVFVPAGRPPHKEGTPILDGATRREMLAAALAGNPHFRVSSVELDRIGPSYTVETIDALGREYGPGCDIHLIVGADNVREFDSWKDPERLLAKCTLLVPTRPGYDLDDLPDWLAERARIIPVTALAISSQEIRRRLREGRTVRYLVPESVRHMILERGLYRD
jgi:nicotinate-nucleotide adenylyltransferase